MPEFPFYFSVDRCLSFLASTGLTAIFELLQPCYQHVECLNYLMRYVTLTQLLDASTVYTLSFISTVYTLSFISTVYTLSFISTVYTLSFISTVYTLSFISPVKFGL